MSESIPSYINVLGLNRIFDSKAHALRRLFWTLIFALAFGFLCWNLFDRFVYWADGPLLTKTFIEIPNSIQAPMVTFCHGDEIIPSQDIANSRDLIQKIYEMSTAYGDRVESNSTNIRLEAVNLRRRAALHSEDLFLNAIWENIILKKEDFTEIDIGGRMCYAVNSNGSRYITNSGHVSALAVILDLNSDLMRAEKFNSHFLVFIHNHDTNPTLIGEAVMIAPGTVTQIRLVLEINKAIPTNNICTETSDPRNDLEYFGPKYSTRGCTGDCMLHKVEKRARCHIPHYPLPKVLRYPLCNFSQTQHAAMVFHKLATQCQCALPCHDKNYNPSINSVSFGFSPEIVELYWTVKGKNVSWDYAKQNTAVVTIYFPSLIKKITEQKYAYTILALASDIGGALGLFLGACVFNLIEALEYSLIVLIKRSAVNPKLKPDQ